MTFDQLRKATAARFGISVENLVSPCRKRAFVRPRHIAMLIARNEMGAPLSAIGRAFGGRDHTTVAHALDGISYMVKNPRDGEDYQSDIDHIIAACAEMDLRRKTWVFKTSRDKMVASCRAVS